MAKTNSSAKKTAPKLAKPAAAKKRVLGKGLTALLSDSDPQQARTHAIEEIPLQSISLNPYQPRDSLHARGLEELQQSIAVHGIIQPITVRALGPDTYQLISGERRLTACRKLGMTHMPAFVRKAEDAHMLEMALIENIQREALNAIEIACSYQRLLSECHLRQEDVARRVGKERATVTNYLRLLKLPPGIQAALRDKRISMGHARSLLAIEDSATQLLLMDEITKKQLSVRQVETAVRQLATQKKRPAPAKSLPLAYKALQEELTTYLGTRVQLRTSEARKGQIRISFFSDDDLNRILDLIRT